MKKAYKCSTSHSIFKGPKKHIRTGPDFYVQFVASTFMFNIESFGEIRSSLLNDSLILSNEECVSLVEMTKSTIGNLLYSRDGFTGR